MHELEGESWNVNWLTWKIFLKKTFENSPFSSSIWKDSWTNIQVLFRSNSISDKIHYGMRKKLSQIIFHSMRNRIENGSLKNQWNVG